MTIRKDICNKKLRICIASHFQIKYVEKTHNNNNNNLNKVLYHTKTIKSNRGNISATIYYITLIIALIVKTLLI